MTRDLSGNRMADAGGSRTYTYNNANRLSAVLDGGLITATYVHNALGQRTKKTVGAIDVIYLYDLAGNLLAEHDATGAMIRDYVWMNDAPVAQIDSGEVFRYLHFDHLNTPRLATNDGQTVVWRWDSDAFGTTLADEDPDGDLSATTVNLRFPGQYFDAETGFHYNYFRTYDPSTGRYVESDPIGLGGGRNTFAYVDSNPQRYFDPYGLDLEDNLNRDVGIIGGCVAGAALFGKGGLAACTATGPGYLACEFGALACGCAAGAVGGGLLGLGADTIQSANQTDSKSSGDRGADAQRDKRRKSAPNNKPAGTKPIDKDGRAKGKIHDIKPDIGAAPDDWVGVTPDGEIVTTSPETGDTVWEGVNVNDY